MERLTYWENGKWRLKFGDTEFAGDWVGRIAAYEDTGLEPEGVIHLAECWQQEHEALCQYLTLGSADHLRELVQAEKDGRLVVLPCKVGDTIYFKTYKNNATVCVGIQPHTVHSIRIYCLVEGEYTDVGLPTDQFGKTVFLAREEAEAALKGGDKG